MKLSFIFKLIHAGTAFSSWYKKAIEDGVIDLNEVTALIQELSEIFGLNISFHLPDIQK